MKNTLPFPAVTISPDINLNMDDFPALPTEFYDRKHLTFNEIYNLNSACKQAKEDLPIFSSAYCLVDDHGVQGLCITSYAGKFVTFFSYS